MFLLLQMGNAPEEEGWSSDEDRQAAVAHPRKRAATASPSKSYHSSAELYNASLTPAEPQQLTHQ